MRTASASAAAVAARVASLIVAMGVVVTVYVALLWLPEADPSVLLWPEAGVLAVVPGLGLALLARHGGAVAVLGAVTAGLATVGIVFLTAAALFVAGAG